MEALTARNIADKAGCSTQPIYKIYQNLDSLKENAVRMAGEHAGNIILNYYKTAIPFLNTGLGFIHFAATEKILFRIFNIENYLRQPVFGPLEDKRLYSLMEDLLGDSPLTAEERQEIFLKYYLCEVQHKRALALTARKLVRLVFRLLKGNRLYIPA